MLRPKRQVSVFLGKEHNPLLILVIAPQVQTRRGYWPMCGPPLVGLFSELPDPISTQA